MPETAVKAILLTASGTAPLLVNVAAVLVAVPIVAGPKVVTSELSAATGVATVLLRGISIAVVGETPAMPEVDRICRLAVYEPVLADRKPTVTVQVPFLAKGVVQVLATTLNTPVVLGLVMDTAPIVSEEPTAPLLVIVMVWLAGATLTLLIPKFSAADEGVAIGTLAPTPVRLTVLVPLLLEIVMVPARVPAVFAVKVTYRLHEAPAATVIG